MVMRLLQYCSDTHFLVSNVGEDADSFLSYV